MKIDLSSKANSLHRKFKERHQVGRFRSRKQITQNIWGSKEGRIARLSRLITRNKLTEAPKELRLKFHKRRLLTMLTYLINSLWISLTHRSQRTHTTIPRWVQTRSYTTVKAQSRCGPCLRIWRNCHSRIRSKSTALTTMKMTRQQSSSRHQSSILTWNSSWMRMSGSSSH